MGKTIFEYYFKIFDKIIVDLCAVCVVFRSEKKYEKQFSSGAKVSTYVEFEQNVISLWVFVKNYNISEIFMKVL